MGQGINSSFAFLKKQVVSVFSPAWPGESIGQ
jgi:hypothetical protein